MEREYWDSHHATCDNCHKRITIKDLEALVTAEDCIEYQEDGYFSSESCDECIRTSCTLAKNDIVSDIGMVQDDDGNWCYREDIENEEEF